MRTALTMLGVIIGVSALICTIAIGEGASSKIREAIASIGANVIWVEAGGVNRGGVRTGSGGTKSLTLADMRAIKDQVALITHIPRSSTSAPNSSTATRTGTRRPAASRPII
jgi:putative ABC transport system permease protein